VLHILGSVNPFHRGIDRRTAMSIGGLGAVTLGAYGSGNAQRSAGEFHSAVLVVVSRLSVAAVLLPPGCLPLKR
jgi:hypothetical protein